jgi:hypothetical protein
MLNFLHSSSVRNVWRVRAFGGSTIACARLFFLLLVAAIPAEAQYLGSVNLQTVTQPLFPSTACTGSAQTATINNLGQTSHAVTVIFGTSSPKASYQLQGSNDGVNFTTMSDTIQNGSSGPGTTLQAAGYYTVVRFVINCTSPGFFSATYSGSGVPPGALQGQGLAAEIEKLLFVGLATSNQSGATFPPFGNMSGLIFITTSGSFSGAASLSLTCVYQAGNAASQSFALAGAGPLQFTVPAQPCVDVFWSYTAATSTGTFNLEYVYSAGFSGASGAGSGGTISNVQGITADGASWTGNPVIVGGKTTTGSSCVTCAKNATVLGESAADLTTGTFGVVGVAVGAGNLNPNNNFTGITAPNVGPMASSLFALNSSNGTADQPVANSSTGGTYGNVAAGNAGASLNTMLVVNTGIAVLTSPATISATGATLVGPGPAWLQGTVEGCMVTVTTGTPTGTAPTLDVWFQTSTDGVNFQDMIHFTTITSVAATEKQVAKIVTGTSGLTPQAFQNKALAVTTTLNGPIGAWLQFAYTIGGSASPTFPTTQFGVVCH